MRCGTRPRRRCRASGRSRSPRPGSCARYEPLLAHGTAADHVIAYDRGGAIAVATRLPIGLAAAGGWGDTTIQLPSGHWHESLTGRDLRGGEVPLGVLLGVAPVALLTREDTA